MPSQPTLTKRVEIMEEAMKQLSQAIVQLNHASETLEKHVQTVEPFLGEMRIFKGNMEGQMTWVKILMGSTAVAAFGQLVLSIFR